MTRRPRAWAVLGAVIALVFASVGISAAPADAAIPSGTGSISGHITLPAGIDPATAGLSVGVFEASVDNSSMGGSISPTGDFTVPGLGAGTYKLEFRAWNEPSVLPGWYGGAADFASAATVTLTAGQQLTGIDATLAQAGSIAGTLSGVPDGGANVIVWRLDGTDQWSQAGYQHVAANGPYEISGLAAGTYTLQFNTGVHRDQYWKLQGDLASATRIEVAGGALTGIDADVSAGLSTPSLNVSGSRQVGSVLQVTGTWETQPDTVTYQWYTNGTAIAGATASTYTPTAAVVGASVSVRFVGEKAGYVSATDVIEAGTISKGIITAGTPSITGTTVTGATLTAVPGTWPTGATFTYQWTASGANIAGATGKTFVLTSAQQGRLVAVVVTGTLPGYEPATGRSAGIGPSQADGYAAATPTVSGTPAVASTLTAVTGTWTSGTVLSYQWYASGAAISGATASTFKLTSAQAGKTISVTVTGKLGGNTRAVKPSAATAKVATATTPTVAGSAAVGSTLTATPGAWTAGSALTYQWYASGTAISGATASTFKLTSTQAGKAITVAVKGTLSGYATVTKTSAATAKVATVATPTISGAAEVASTLTAKTGTWTTGTTFTYQWYASGTAISGATASTYKLTSAQQGTTITVAVKGTLSGYPTITKTSAATAKVATVATPWISEWIAVGSTVKANTGTWTSGTTFTYQWYVNGTAVSGATASTFPLTTSHAGKTITLAVKGTLSGYSTITKTSEVTPKVATVATPTISGTAKVGSTLTAKTGTWTTGTAFTYQWYAGGTAIPGATASTYQLATAQKGTAVSVLVTGTLSGYQTIVKGSSAVVPVG
ncbi:beta strand repeat-containing protein [Agromyces sp. NPDC058110]|uniref:beta strand repeat-containing protein n=1 Tax=Agromyces sp. NPDC058110 TaxID=3346345 RepID=UPI0036D79BF9